MTGRCTGVPEGGFCAAALPPRQSKGDTGVRLRKEIDVSRFLQVVTNCRGNVYCKTKEEDVLNLKSVLTRYVFVTLTASPELLEGAVVDCDDASDYERLSAFLVS